MTRRQRVLDLLFFTALSLLLCHELDAVAQSEWRLLPVLKRLSDESAYGWFVALHIPLFALLLWWTSSTIPKIRCVAQLTLDGFMMVHAGLHLALHDRPEYTFHAPLSEALIFGAAVLATAHFVACARDRSGIPARGLSR